MSENSKEKQIIKCYAELSNIEKKINSPDISLDDIPVVLESIEGINRTLSSIKVNTADKEYTQLLYIEACSYIEPLKKKAQSRANEIADATPVQNTNTREGIVGETKKYYEGLNFAEAKDDGNCFYYSIAAALNAENGAFSQPKLSQQALRDKVADFYQNSLEERQFLEPILVIREQEKIQKQIEDTIGAIDIMLARDSKKKGEEKQQTLTRLRQQLKSLREKRDLPIEITESDIRKHINRIKTTKEWADESTIAALSTILQRPIVVVEGKKAENIKIRRPIYGEEQEGDPIFVHYNGTHHYNALIVKPGYNAKEILEDLKQLKEDKASSTAPAAKKPRNQ